MTSKHVLAFKINAMSSGSWGVGDDVWQSIDIHAKPADYVANKLEIPGFTGDLLFKYVLDYFQPTIYGGEVPLKYKIDDLKAKEIISIRPQQHLWYDAWNHTLKNKRGKWDIEGKCLVRHFRHGTVWRF